MLGRQTASVESARSRRPRRRTSSRPTARVEFGAADEQGTPPASDSGVRTAPPVVKLAAAYARGSTDRHAQQESIPSQLEVLQRAATERGDDLPAECIFIDGGYSGARLDRPALDRLRDLVSDGAIEVVLVCSPDRLARHYAYQVVVLEEFKRAGCEMAFLNRPFGQSPEEQMLLRIQGVFAE